MKQLFTKYLFVIVSFVALSAIALGCKTIPADEPEKVTKHNIFLADPTIFHHEDMYYLMLHTYKP